MTMTRMQILLVAVLTFVWICPLQAQRGPYPSAPVRIVVAFPPGGGVDVVARLIAQKMTAVWSQQVVVENRPGAAGILATHLVASAAPDGYNVLTNSNILSVNLRFLEAHVKKSRITLLQFHFRSYIISV